VAVGLVLVATRRGLTQGAEAGVDRGGRKIFGVREGELEEVVREGDIGGGGGQAVAEEGGKQVRAAVETRQDTAQP